MGEDKEVFKTHMACLSKKRAEIDETAHLKKYIMWENKSNSCWLDASMALIAHNKVMKRASLVCPQSKISYIIASYAEAISIINNSLKSSNQWVELVNLAKSKLNCVQDTTLQYLTPILKYKPGDPDSAFCSLYNLLKQDPIIKGIFDVTWVSDKTCTNCAYHAESTITKPVITLSKIDSFDPKSPAVIYNCKCGKSEQTIKFMLLTLPPCLIFHFENGAGHEKPPLSFVTQGREYYLTGIMTLEKGQESNVNHFISWVRDPFVDKWLDCNDLNPDIIYFTPNFPDIRFEDVSFYVYESFDDLGTIRDYKVVNIKNSEEDIPCIDISEESESENSNSVSNASGAVINAKKQEVSSTESQNATFSTEMGSSKSQKEIAGNEEHISDEEINQSNSAQRLEANNNEIKDAENDKNETESIKKTSPDQSMDIQNEEKMIDSGFQDFRISDDKSGKDAPERVSQTNYDDKSNFEECKLDDQIKTCYDQKQTDVEDIVSPYEKTKLENTVAIEKKNGIEMKDDEQNKALLPSKELHISDLGERKPEDITKVDISKSGTSYVKLSFPRKKYPGLTFLKQNSVKKDKIPTSDDNETTSVKKSPKSMEETKTSKRNRAEECDTMPQKRPRKNQKFEQTLEALQSNANKEDITHSMPKKDPKMSFQDKSKLKNNVGKKKFLQKHMISHLTSKDKKSSKEQNQLFTNQQTYSSMFSATENSNKNDNDEGKILKEFENVWSSHKPSCNCERKSLEETIDIVVDYTFAYLGKLSQGLKKEKQKAGLKKANSH